MIVYHSAESAFLDTVLKHDIEGVIHAQFRARMGHGVSGAELRSWKESLLAMAKVLNDDGRHNLVIVELKQWEHAKRTAMDGVVRTRFASGEADTSHAASSPAVSARIV